jgi:peptidoglycan-associated lipoprotein
VKGGKGMRKGFHVIIAVMALCMIVFIVGCAKKTIEQAKEISQPQPTPPVVTPEQPGGMKMETPKAEAPAGIESQKPALEQEIASFEQNDIYFDFDKFDLSPEARKVLAEKASFLNAHPQMKIRVEGNCDERGTIEYNLALGDRRAKAALDYLVFLGITPERISTISYGKERPVDPGHNEEAWAKNRRDHFVIIKK